MRLLDCKVPHDHEIAQGAPTVLDYLCDECSAHFEGVKRYLDANGVAYTVNPTIVRGLDYYTKTVFEFLSGDIGAQSAVCAGGRYDGLIEELGGNPMPALGFAAGIERLLLTLEAQGVEIPARPHATSISPRWATMRTERGADSALQTVGARREFDVVGRGLKAQMKYANKIGARFSIVLGDNEIEEGKAKLKNMLTGEQSDVPLEAEAFINAFTQIKLNDEFKELEEKNN